jgi:hypothetical protein
LLLDAFPGERHILLQGCTLDFGQLDILHLGVDLRQKQYVCVSFTSEAD